MYIFHTFESVILTPRRRESYIHFRSVKFDSNWVKCTLAFLLCVLRLIMGYKHYWGVSRGTQWWINYRSSLSLLRKQGGADMWWMERRRTRGSVTLCLWRFIRTVGGEKCKSQPRLLAMIWASQWFTHPWKKKKLLLAFIYLTLNPAKSLWNKIPFSSIILSIPRFMRLFVSHDILTIITLSSFHPLLNSHSYMTLTSAPISPFCLNLFTISFNSPLFPLYYFSMCEWWSMHA